MRSKEVVISVILSVVLLSLTACSKTTTVTGDNGEKAEINVDQGTTTIKNKDGETTYSSNSKDGTSTIETKDEQGKTQKMEFSDGSSSTVPDGFPQEIPILDKAKIISSIKTTIDGKISFVVIYEALQSMEDAKKVYQNFCKKKEYTNINELSIDDLFLTGGELAEETFNVSITNDKATNKTTVSIAYSIPQK